MEKKQYVRHERDTLGEIAISNEFYWGAQTQRAINHFNIGNEKIPADLIGSLAVIKKAAAQVNTKLGFLSKLKAKKIIKAAEEVMMGKHQKHFPLHVWQSGSGTQTNMNVNEVIANRAAELAKREKGDKNFIHPNDHVNLFQSTNDVFPTAMHIVTARNVKAHLLPILKKLRDELKEKQKQFKQVIKVGRTHLQDAVPLTLGQEFSGYVSQIDINLRHIEHSMQELLKLPIGGTAVGTGLNAPKNFDRLMVKEISAMTGLSFRLVSNKFAAIASHDALGGLSGILKNLASSLFKIANDLRWLASGPRCGLGELILPSNEPGSSMMPGKVNPTQCEAMMMVCIQVMANDVAITFAGSQGNFELNTFKPIIIFNLLQSIQLLSDACQCFLVYCVSKIKINEKRLSAYVEDSLMKVTALTSAIGYDKAAKIAQYAYQNETNLRTACQELGYLSEKEFSRLVDVTKMVGGGKI